MQRRSSGSVQIFYPRFKKEEIIRTIRGKLERLGEQLPIRFVVLIGSYAKGDHTVRSDIDLLLVYEGKERDDAYAVVKSVIGLPGLEPHVYTNREYDTVKDTLERMMEDGIVLFGKGAEKTAFRDRKIRKREAKITRWETGE